MNIYITAIVAIVFFILATVVIVTTSQQEQEIRFLNDEEQDREQHYSIYRESFRVLALAVAWTVVAVAFVGYSLFTY